MQRPAKIWTIPYSLAVWYCTWKWTLSAFLFFPAEFGLSGEGGVVTPAGQNHFCKQWRKTVGGCGGDVGLLSTSQKRKPRSPPPSSVLFFSSPLFSNSTRIDFFQVFLLHRAYVLFPRGVGNICEICQEVHVFNESRHKNTEENTDFQKKCHISFQYSMLIKIEIDEFPSSLVFPDLLCGVVALWTGGEYRIEAGRRVVLGARRGEKK